MNSLSSQTNHLKIFLGICVLQVFLNLPTLQIAEFYLNSDFSVYYLFADGIGTKYSSPFFYYESSYGGTILAHIRSLFTTILTPALSNLEFSKFAANQIFTFVILPLIFNCAVFYTCTAFFSKSAAIFVSLITATGIQYWVHRLGSDFYWVSIFYGLLVLRYRTNFQSPFEEMNIKALFLFCVLSGFAIYTFRTSSLFFISFFIPNNFPCIKKINFFSKEVTVKILISLAGFVIGFLPEFVQHIYFIYNSQFEFSLQNFSEQQQTFSTLLMPALQEIVTGSNHLLHYFGFEKNFSYVLFTFASFGSFYSISKGEKKLMPATVSALMTMTFFLFFKTYTHGATRYLFSLIPFLLLSLGNLWELSKNSYVKYMIILLTAGSISYHLQDRFISRAHILNTGQNEKLYATIRFFKSNNVRVALTDDYWESNTYTAITQGKPFFISLSNPWAQREALELVKIEKKIGLRLSKEMTAKNMTIFQRNCEIDIGNKLTIGKMESYLYMASCE